jgi:hypothetical protein
MQRVTEWFAVAEYLAFRAAMLILFVMGLWNLIRNEYAKNR